jgi:hypothetical protein
MGFFSKIGKIFKKVTSSKIFKVAAAVLGVAAVVFTGGAALGLAPFAGGFGAAMGGISSALGLTGTVGSVLTGALTAGGYGAAIGGLTSLATGGDPLDGASMGLATGALTGGLLGGFGVGVDPFAGIGTKAAPAATGGAGLVGGPATTPATAGMATPSLATTGPATAGAATTGPASVASASSLPAAGQGGGLLGAGGWIERNGALVGSTLSGLGQGLATGMAAGDKADAEREQFDRISGNFAMPEGGYEGSTSPADGPRPTPAVKWESGATPARKPRWRYNRETAQVEYG